MLHRIAVPFVLFLVPALAGAEEPSSAPPAAAQPPPVATTPGPDAQVALAEALALVRAEMWEEALTAADRAVQQSPGWAEAYRVRASIRYSLTLTSEARALLDTPQEGGDYAALRQKLEGVASDWEMYVALTSPEEAERTGVAAKLAEAREQAAACTKAEQDLAAQAERRRQEEVERQRAEAERQQRLEQQRREEEARRVLKEQKAREAEVRREYEQRLEHARSTRAAGGTLLVIGGALAAGAGTCLYLGNHQNEQIRAGGFATALDIHNAAALGKTYNTLATIGVIGSGVMTLIGLPIVLFNGDPPPLTPSLMVSKTGMGVTFAGDLP